MQLYFSPAYNSRFDIFIRAWLKLVRVTKSSHRWFHLKGQVIRDFQRFLWCKLEQSVEQRIELLVIWDAMTIIWCHCLQVSNRTTPTTVVCACTHLTSFASQVFVAPNTIDFSTVFNDFGNQLLRNYHVLITLGLILLLYVVLLVYLRRKDQQDIIKVNWCWVTSAQQNKNTTRSMCMFIGEYCNSYSQTAHIFTVIISVQRAAVLKRFRYILRLILWHIMTHTP